MPDLICLSSLHKFSRKLWQQLMKKWRKEKKKKRRRKGRRLVLSGLNTLASAIESSSSQFRQVFRFLDANGDGKISPLELSQVLMRLGHEKALAAAEAERMVREMDCDGDGLVDEEEFMKIIVVKADGEIGDDDDEEDGVMDAFNVFDADKDGLISAKELQRVLLSLGWEKCSLGECREMIKGVDRDGDGFVDFEEFQWMMASSKS
ncbi:uncharacterized protein LOC127787081 [Diospyros lotus]|uniref:uncharacterized protein LOC127787081 n=1 Tax=Diospyros lotus TaxID=55363 RepID=UPI00225B9AC4|nr:uncharacterized protein LOC127787081 [Diospyros lotus]